ncbi:MAG: ATP-binding protein [Phycisphaerales bacterium JB050]
MVRGISLANKCLLLFSVAVLVIVSVALIVPWIRLAEIIDDAQIETSRQLAAISEQSLADPSLPAPRSDSAFGTLTIYRPDEWASLASTSEDEREFKVAARNILTPELSDDRAETSGPDEFFQVIREGGARRYDYARAFRDPSGQLERVVVLSRRSEIAEGQLFVNRMLLLASGMLASAVAVAVFYIITTRIILSPVRELRDTAELVREGNLDIRSDIRTRDEFQELSDTFNDMLEAISKQQNQLRAINTSLDLKLTEMAEANVALFEAAKLKGEFLANVSHELRTPLNSIIGFAEILQDIVHSERDSESLQPPTPEQLAKRQRYTDHIVSAGRSLLEMINELLTMAKLEAGRMELQIRPVNIPDLCEALIALIRPLAEKKQIDLRLQLGQSQLPSYSGKPGADIPIVHTDPQKLQQIVFNFLSNAVKFTPDQGRVTLRAERIVSAEGMPRVRMSVLDTGPGIPADQQKAIFEKFRQLDSGHTKAAAGTGLGLAIARQFAEMLQGEIHLVSEEDRGAMFSVVIPVEYDPNKLTEHEQVAAEAERLASRD